MSNAHGSPDGVVGGHRMLSEGRRVACARHGAKDFGVEWRVAKASSKAALGAVWIEKSLLGRDEAVVGVKL